MSHASTIGCVTPDSPFEQPLRHGGRYASPSQRKCKRRARFADFKPGKSISLSPIQDELVR